MKSYSSGSSSGRRHRGGGQTPAVHRHARPLRDRAIVHLILGTGLRRAEITDRDRHLGVLRPHDLRHTFGYRLSEASGHNRAELERRLGHANDRYLRLYTNPPDDIAAGYVEDL
jgi:integrase